ncbi:MAG: hypothetical protein DIU78_012135 [Pseudomonadota bacterium]|nr:MAG: hypothetical protein DIU78_18635 [Pseudomonadota bacterium]
MRRLHAVRPGSVTVEVESSIALAVLLVPLVAVLTALPWVYAESTVLGRAVTTLGGGAALVAALAAQRPRRREIAIPAGATLELENAPAGEDDRYRVVLHQGERRVLLLDHGDPARAIAELREIVRVTRAAVRPGWGLTDEDLEPGADPGDVVLHPLELVAPCAPGQVRAGVAGCGGALFVLVMFLSAPRAELEIHTLSVALPLLSVVGVAAIGVLVLGVRRRVTITARGLRVEHLVFGRATLEIEVPRTELVAARATAPGTRTCHVLLETRSGPRSIAVGGDAADAIVRAVQKTPAHAPVSELTNGRAVSTYGSVLEHNPY